MEIEASIKISKEIYSPLIDFIDASDDSESEFKAFVEIFHKHDIIKKEELTKELFQLISEISNNHQRSTDFFNKISQIFHFIFDNKELPISPNEIYLIYSSNKAILYLLLDQELLIPNETILDNILSKEKNQLHYFLFSKLKKYLEKEKILQIEKEIKEKYDEDLESFDKKCQIGENDSYVCQLIRNDSVEEFVSYVTRTNLSHSSRILPSIYETNLYLTENKPSLIEYAAFFGSIQIFQYLRYNNVEFADSLWIYAIHSNNAELIHILEEIHSESIKENCKEVVKESIKCHHNNICDYLKDHFLPQSNENRLDKEFDLCIIKSHNYKYYPDNICYLFENPRYNDGFNIPNLSKNYTTITIPSGTTRIYDQIFYDCSSLTKIVIPSSVTSIGNNVFEECVSLKEILIPPSVTIIGNNSFYGCTSIEEISIPSSVKSIGYCLFFGCKSLKNVSISALLPSIPTSTFCECSSLVNVNIPSSVVSIKGNAFHGCSSLKEISIPSSVTSIAFNAFYGCSSLIQVTIPSSVKKIGVDCFKECSSLEQISIPHSTDINRITDPNTKIIRY